MPTLFALALLLAACWTPAQAPTTLADRTASANPPGVQSQAVTIQVDLGGKVFVLERSGVGQVNPNGVTAQTYFVVDPAAVTALLAKFDAAKFGAMPGLFGVPYQDERPMPFDCAREPCDRRPTRTTKLRPLYRVSVRRGDVEHTVTQSAEGHHSTELEGLVHEVLTLCEAAIRDRSLSNKLTLQQELGLVADRTLPLDALHVGAGHNFYQDGSIVEGWSIVLHGTHAIVTVNPSNQKLAGELTPNEHRRLRDALASTPMPYMGYVSVDDRSHSFLNARILHSTNINSNSGPGITFDPAVQHAFDRAVVLLDGVRRRIQNANRTP